MSPLFWEKSICVVAACNKVAHSFAWERRISKPLYPRADDGPDQLSLSRASFERERVKALSSRRSHSDNRPRVKLNQDPRQRGNIGAIDGNGRNNRLTAVFKSTYGLVS